MCARCEMADSIDVRKKRIMKPRITVHELSDLLSEDPKTMYKRAKWIRAIAEKNPQQLYPHRRFFVKLLRSENNILKWTAIDIVGYLSSADKKSRIDITLNNLVSFLHGGKLIAANHAIRSLARVAQARPETQERVIAELLSVEQSTYESEECRNIALGKVIEALGQFCSGSKQNDRVVNFVKRQTANSRPATRKRAQKLFLNLGASSTRGG